MIIMMAAAMPALMELELQVVHLALPGTALAVHGLSFSLRFRHLVACVLDGPVDVGESDLGRDYTDGDALGRQVHGSVYDAVLWFSVSSMRLTQEAQVMPSTGRVTVSTSTP